MAQTTVWAIKHKLAQVMMKGDATKQLTGRVELDDACLGGEGMVGSWGRRAAGKMPFVTAVETTPEGKPVRLKPRRVTSFRDQASPIFAKCGLNPACAVLSDSLTCFGAVADARCAHQVTKTGLEVTTARIPAFKWVDTVHGSIKPACVGTWRAIDQKHVLCCLTEFEYRFNRRYDLAVTMPRLLEQVCAPHPHLAGCSNWPIFMHEMADVDLEENKPCKLEIYTLSPI